MFWKTKKVEIEDPRCKVLEYENNKLSIEVDNLRQRLSTIEKQVTDAEVFIDFDRMKVFSIERMINDNRLPCTIVGYYVNEPVISHDGEMIVNRDVVREWNLFCSDKQHTQLIRDFKVWKNSNV